MNITLRDWQQEDIGDLKKFADNRNIWNSLADAFPNPYTDKDAIEFVEKVQGDLPRKILAIDIDGQAIGSIGIFPDKDIAIR